MNSKLGTFVLAVDILGIYLCDLPSSSPRVVYHQSRSSSQPWNNGGFPLADGGTTVFAQGGHRDYITTTLGSLHFVFATCAHICSWHTYQARTVLSYGRT